MIKFCTTGDFMSPILNLGKLLNTDEIEDTKTFVKANKNLWVHESLYLPSAKNTPRYIFGSPLMYSENGNTEYLSLYRTVRTTCEPILKDITLLNRVLSLLEDYYKLPTQHIRDTSLPGFQIYSSYENKSKRFLPGYHHVDSTIVDNWEALNFDPLLKFSLDTIYALIVTIEFPTIGDTLQYIVDGTEYSYKYEIGHAYTWKSNMLHRTGPVVLNEDECRIIYICFYSIQPDKILYYY